MIIEGRSLNLRHVSRTHRVALDCLYDRMNLDPKIRIRYVDTKNQLADILTKGHFTRDEWNHIPCLYNIIFFSSQSCTESRSQNWSEAMSKRQQEGDYDESVVAKPMPDRNLVSMSCVGPSMTASSTVTSSPVKFGSGDHEMSLLSATEWRTFERSTRTPDRGQQRGRPWHKNRAKLLNILQPMQVALYLLLKSWDAGSGLETKEEFNVFCFNLIQRKSGWEAANVAELSSRQRDETKWQEFFY